MGMITFSDSDTNVKLLKLHSYFLKVPPLSRAIYDLYSCEPWSWKSKEKSLTNSKAVNIPVFSILWALKIADLVSFNIQKVQKFVKSKFRTLKCILTLDQPKLISRKICVTENFCNIHSMRNSFSHSFDKNLIKTTFFTKEVSHKLISRNICQKSVR